MSFDDSIFDDDTIDLAFLDDTIDTIDLAFLDDEVESFWAAEEARERGSDGMIRRLLDAGNARCAITKHAGSVERVTDGEIRSLLRSLSEEERETVRSAGADPDKADRILPWTISTEQRDRDHDRIMVNGWDLANYRRNPVILFGHNHNRLPVGKSVRVWKDLEGSPRLRALALFTPKGMGDGFGYSVYELAKNGFLPASSVGFKPGKYEKDADDESGRGYVFANGHELLEWSPVTVPSNPGALQEARGLGIDLNPYALELERVLDGEPAALALSRTDAERFIRAIRPARPTIVAPGDIRC